MKIGIYTYKNVKYLKVPEIGQFVEGYGKKRFSQDIRERSNEKLKGNVFKGNEIGATGSSTYLHLDGLSELEVFCLAKIGNVTQHLFEEIAKVLPNENPLRTKYNALLENLALQDNVKRLSQDVKRLSEDVKSKTQDVKRLSEDVKSKTQESGLLAQDVKRLESEVRTKTQEVKRLSQDVEDGNSNKDQLHKLRADYLSVKKELAEAKGTRFSNGNDIARLQALLESEKKQNSTLSESLEVTLSELNSMQATTAGAISKKEQLQREYDLLKSNCEGSTEIIDRYKEAIQTAQSDLLNKSQEIAFMRMSHQEESAKLSVFLQKESDKQKAISVDSSDEFAEKSFGEEHEDLPKAGRFFRISGGILLSIAVLKFLADFISSLGVNIYIAYILALSVSVAWEFFFKARAIKWFVSEVGRFWIARKRAKELNDKSKNRGKAWLISSGLFFLAITAWDSNMSVSGGFMWEDVIAQGIKSKYAKNRKQLTEPNEPNELTKYRAKFLELSNKLSVKSRYMSDKEEVTAKNVTKDKDFVKSEIARLEKVHQKAMDKYQEESKIQKAKDESANQRAAIYGRIIATFVVLLEIIVVLGRVMEVWYAVNCRAEKEKLIK